MIPVVNRRYSAPLAAALLLSVSAGESLWAQEPNAKAVRLLEPLTKRPGSGPLFERFVNAWLDTETLEGLGRFLGARVAADPSPANRVLLALFHSRQGEPVKALEQFRAALTADPGSADIWYQKALLESRTLDFDAAIASLGRCLGAKPQAMLSSQASQLLGRLQARSGKTEDALKTWKALVESRPGDEELREDILELQIAESLWPAAQATAAALVEATKDPYRRVLRRMRLGDVFDRAGQREKALETFAASLEETGEGSWLEKEILSQMEKLFRREDDLAGLKEYFTKLLDKHARRAGLQRALARLLMETGEPEAAIERGRALMALSPGDRAVREEFIALLTSAGRAGDAIPQVAQLLKRAPGDLELRLTLADLKHAGKDEAGALAELRDYATRAANQEGTALRVAGLMDRYGLMEEAIGMLREVLAKTPGQAEARLMLASLLHKSGKKEEALTEWRALATGGTLPVVQQAARAMQARGEGAGAWELMQAAASRGQGDAVFLTQLCALADTGERAKAVEPAARRLVELAKSPSDLAAALDAALRVLRLGGTLDAVMAELAGSAATAQALCLLATLRESTRDTLGADAALEKARALSPELALAQLVRLWSMRGDFGQAARAAENLFNSPGGRQGHVAEMLATLHQRAGDTAAALRWTQEWRKLTPGAVAPVLAEARLLQAAGRDAEALTALRAAAGRFETNEDIRASLASASLRAGREAEALRLYSNLYEEAPDLTAKMRWLQAWGKAAQEAGRIGDLITQFEDRRRENRESVVPLMALAELHRLTDSYDARRQALTEAARLKPADPEIALEIARLESRERNDEAAIQTLRPFLGKDPSGKVAAFMAELLLNTGKEEEGLKLIGETTAATPGAVENATLALIRRGDEKMALEWLRPRVAAWPEDWRLAYLTAMLEWRTDQNEEAAARLLPLTSTSTPLPRLSGGNGPVSQIAGAGFEEMTIQQMPPDTQRFLRLVQAFSALNLNPYFGRRTGYYSQLPSDPVELQYRAAALILQIGRLGLPEKAAEWAEALEARGFASARLVPDLPEMRQTFYAERDGSFEGLLKKHPGNRPLLALAAMNSAFRSWQDVPDADLAERVWKAYQGDAPMAALFLALPATGQREKPGAWEQEAMAAAEKLEKAPPLVLLSLIRAGGLALDDGGPISKSKAPPNPAWRAWLTALLRRWQEALDAEGSPRGFMGNLRQYVFTGMAREYAATKEAAALAALLDAEWRMNESRQTPSQSQGHSRGNESLADGLGFPPDILPGLTDEFRKVIQKTIPPGVAALTVPHVREPMVRVLLLSRGGAPEPVEKAIGEMLERQTSTAGPLILAAAWQEKAGHFQAAAELALKALYLPVSPETRRRLDGALAGWAVKKGKPGDPLYIAGREAALRLRRDAVTEELRAELARLMDLLGLPEEADRLIRQGKAQDAAAATAVTPLERARKFLKEGREKEGLALLVSEFRERGRQCVTSGNLSVSQEVAVEWRTLVQTYGLMPAVMAAARPPDDAAQALAGFAAACAVQGDLETARESYAKALAAGLKKTWTPLLARLAATTDPARFVKVARDLPDAWVREGVGQWTGEFFVVLDQGKGLEARIAYGRFVDQVLDLMPESAFQTFPVDLVLGTLGEDAYCGIFYRVPEINRGKPPEALLSTDPLPAETARVEALVKERRELYVKLCRKLLIRPGCGVRAWTLLRALPGWSETESASLFGDGISTLKRELAAMTERKKGNRTSEAEGAAGMIPRLMRDASLASRTADFAAVLPAARDAKSREVNQALEPWTLYEVPAAEFPAAARDFVRRPGRDRWTQVVDAATLRETGLELTDAILQLSTLPPEIDQEDLSFRFADWAGLIEDLQGRAVAEKFMRTALDNAAGPPEGRKALLEDSKNQSRRLFVRQMLTPLFYKSWIGFASAYARDFVPETDGGSDVDFPGWGNNVQVSQFSASLESLLEEKDFQKAREYLDSLPLSGEPAAFWGCGELMHALAVPLESVPEEKMEALGFGGDPAKLSFGRRWLLAEKESKAICDVLAAWKDRIAALPPSRRRHVMESLREGLEPSDDYGASEKPLETTDEGRAFRVWLLEDTRAKEREKAEKEIAEYFEKAGSGAIESADDLEGALSSLLPSLAATRHPRGREIIRHACGLSVTLSDPGAGHAFTEAFSDNRKSSQDWRSVQYNGWLLGMLAEALHSPSVGPALFDLLGNYGGNSGFLNLPYFTSEKTSRVFEMLGPVLQPGESRLLIPRVLSVGYMGLDYGEGVEWLKKNGAQSPWPEMIRDLETSLLLYNAWAEDMPVKGTLREEDLPLEQKRLLELLRDASLSPALRLKAGVSTRGYPDFVEPPVILETAALLRRILEERMAVEDKEEAEVFKALAILPQATRDMNLVKSLLPLTTLSRLGGRNFNYLTDGLGGVLELALSAGDEALVDRLLGMEENFPDFAVLVILARHGEKERLAALLNRKPEILHSLYSSSPFVFQDAALQAHLPAVLEGVKDPVARFEARVLLEMLPDRPVPEPKVHSAISRLPALAESYAAMSWRDLEAKDRILMVFAQADAWKPGDPAVPGSLFTALKEATARVPVEALPFLESEARTRYETLHSRLILNEAQAGNPEPLRKALHRLKSREDDSDQAALSQSLHTGFITGVLAAWPGMKEDVCAGWRACLADHLDPGWPFRGRDQALYSALVLHALAGRMADLEAWHAALPEETRRFITATVENYRAGDVYSLASALPGTKEEKEARLAKIASALAINPFTSGPGDSLFSDYMDQPEATAAGFLKLEEPLLKARPGNPWLVLAFAQARASLNEWDAVLERTSAALGREIPTSKNGGMDLLDLCLEAMEKTGRIKTPPPEILRLRLLPDDGDTADLKRMLKRLLKRLDEE